MALHLVDLQRCSPQPWRNGGGLTRELLAWPQAERWLLRVSVARIERSGPFSAFAGVRRCFALLQGAGVTLDLPQGSTTLTPDDDAIGFDGEDAPGCRLVDGATEDLNLMAMRDAGRPRLQRARAGSQLAGGRRWRGLYTAAPATIDIDGRHEPLAAGTLAWSDDADATPWRLHAGDRAWWLRLET